MNRLSSTVLLLAALLPPALAQDPTRPAPTVAGGPVLVVKTTQPQLAVMLARAFDRTDPLPDLPEHGHYQITLGRDQQLAVQAAKGAAGFLEATADPGGLMDLFAEPIEAAKPMIRGAFTMAFSQQGMQPKDVVAFVDDLLAFPRQLQRLSLKVTGDPQEVRSKGMDVVFTLEPKTGSPVASFVDALQPNPLGVPVLPASGEPLASAQLSLAPAAVQKFAGPLIAWTVRMAKLSADEQQQAMALYERMLKLQDCTASVTFGQGDQGQFLVGVVDGDAMRQLIASDEYAAMAKAQGQARRDVEVQFTPAAFAHRGAKVNKMRMTFDQPNPLLPDGKLDMWMTAVGNVMLGTIGGKESDAKAVIDAVADQKVKRVQIPDGDVLQLKMAIDQIAARMGHADQEMPANFTLAVGAHDKELRVRVRVQ